MRRGEEEGERGRTLGGKGGKGAERRGGRQAERGEEGEKREEGGVTSFSFSPSSSLPSLSPRLVSSISVTVTPTTLIVASFSRSRFRIGRVEQEGCQDFEPSLGFVEPLRLELRVMMRISPTFSPTLQVRP